MEYRLTDLAFGDLVEIHTYIAQDRPEAARRFIGRLYDRFEFLARFPEAGERRPEFAGGDIRIFSAWSYVIYYRIRASYVEIARVIHGARSTESLFDNIE
ncbi:MAG: type II toxin-antitoxin system RelE/ParE family toxin [Pirellulales bacterium]